MSSMQIDFTTPCAPNIHAMPKHIRDAGAKIRREIQQLYDLIEYETRCDYVTQHVRPARYAELGKKRPHVTPSRAEVAQKRHDDLYQAYHAWANTASAVRPYRADWRLLRRVYEGAK